MNEHLILVDENDREVGSMEKMKVHQLGRLHRAFSAFIFNSYGQLILQQRAQTKYHSAGLWSNTCCSHPVQGELLADAVKRRLREEMGLECDIQFQFSFRYKTHFENGLTEHEFDHVFFGWSHDAPKPCATEVMNWKYISLPQLAKEINANPQAYTAWIKLCLPEVMKRWPQFSFLKTKF